MPLIGLLKACLFIRALLLPRDASHDVLINIGQERLCMAPLRQDHVLDASLHELIQREGLLPV